DQAGAELRQIKDADDESEQAGDVEENDAARQAREALADEELPDALGHPAQTAVAIDAEKASRQAGEAVGARRRRRFIETGRLGGLLRCFGGSVEQWGRCRLLFAPRVPPS